MKERIKLLAGLFLAVGVYAAAKALKASNVIAALLIATSLVIVGGVSLLKMLRTRQ